MTAQEVTRIVQRILKERPDLSEADVFRMIDERKQRLGGGLTSDLAAAYMLTSELGIEMEKTTPAVRVAGVIPGLNDVTVTGRIIFLYPAPKGKAVNVQRAILADKSGSIRVAFWREGMKLISGVREGDIVRIHHAYTRLGLDGKPEINVGGRATVQVNPADAPDGEYPTVESFFKKLGEITPDDKRAFAVSVIEERLPAKRFLRRGEEGKLIRATLRDETGAVTACFWDDKADEVEKIEVGRWVRIMNARVRTALDGSVELHIGRATKVRVLDKPPAVFPICTRISKLQIGMRSVNVIGRVIAVSTARIPSLLLDDGSGIIPLNLWGERAHILDKVKIGDVLLVKSADVRSRFDRPFLVLSRLGSVSLNPDLPASMTPPPVTERTTKIHQIREGQRNITVEGEIVEPPVSRQVVTMKGDVVTVASFKMSDETGTIRVSVWRDLANEIKDLPIGRRLRIRNMLARIGLGGKVELSSTIFTSIELPSKKIEVAVPKRQIAGLAEGDRVMVQGRIRGISSPSYVYPACPECLLRAKPSDETFICPNCGTVKPFYRITITAILEDQTGQVKVIMTSPMLENMLGISGEEAWSLQQRGEEGPLFSRVVGKTVSLVGRMTRLGKEKYLTAESLLSY